MNQTAKQELRAKPVSELQSMVADLRGQLLKGRFAKATEGQGLGAKARGVRREVARLLTIITEKQKAGIQG